jgi:oligoribonuclease NrnB/cAMP/cGMP phosphodiesterase (DHH superfamily)
VNELVLSYLFNKINIALRFNLLYFYKLKEKEDTMQKYEKIYHISDTDLDGYASQYLMSLTDENIENYNVRVHGVEKVIDIVLRQIKQEKPKSCLLLITDLSFGVNIIEKINKFKGFNRLIKFEVQLLDHHKTHQKSAKEDWYHYDISKCATSLTADYILSNFSLDDKKQEKISFISNLVNAHDIWIEDDPLHHKGNFLSDLVFNLKIFEKFPDLKRDLTFKFIDYMSTKFSDGISIIEAERLYPDMISSILQEISDIDTTNKDKINKVNIDNVPSKHKLFFLAYLAFEKMDFETIYYDNSFDFLKPTYSLKACFDFEPGLFQYLSHYYLDYHPELDFLMNITFNGSASMRSKGTVDVEKIAKIEFNGGGHQNAAGFKVTDLDRDDKNNDGILDYLCNYYTHFHD